MQDPEGELFFAGRIYTLESAQPQAEAALVRGGRFVSVGIREECERAAGPSARFIDLGEGCAVPGLIDAHGHVLLYGRSLVEVNCAGATSEEECAARAALAARGAPAGSFIRGYGWSEDAFPNRRLPSADSLSAAVPDHPVALTRIDCHALWVNRKALEMAYISAKTRDPPGGRILRRADGSPSGILVDAAMQLVLATAPQPGPRETADLLLRALRALASFGLSSVHDAGVSEETLEVYRKLAEEDRLPLRVYAMLDGQQPEASLVRQMELWKKSPFVGRLTVRAVKMFADGALGSRGARLFEPYVDDPGNRGLWLTSPEELRRRIERVAAAGYQPCVHAIGDHACAEVLSAFSELPLTALRPRVEHLQLLRPRDAPLLRKAGAVASMQPQHATSDGPWAELRIGQGTERQRGAYAWRQALEAGAPLAFGSDFPVEPPDARLGLFSAVARLANGAPWMPEQQLALGEALAAFTSDAAFAEHAEEKRGRIRPGYEADMTLFDRDLFRVPPEELPAVGVVATVVGGRVEFERA